jgi:hypothetical protein
MQDGYQNQPCQDDNESSGHPGAQHRAYLPVKPPLFFCV